MISSYNDILSNISNNKKLIHINLELIRSFHKQIIKNLGDESPAIPGQFRKNNVVVGYYKPPDYSKIPDYMNKYCNWLKEIRVNEPDSIETNIIKAIAAHVYLEWIHPFGDGNGRTGRLIEFYILVRSGFPSLAGHILSNFYNNTRDKYYRMFEICKERKSLTPFLDYAILGLRDGLKETYTTIKDSQIDILWQKVINNTFENKLYTKKVAHNRKKKLMLNFPLHTGLLLNDIPLQTNTLEYISKSSQTLSIDIKELESNKLLIKKDDGKYYANWEQVYENYFDKSAKPTVL